MNRQASATAMALAFGGVCEEIVLLDTDLEKARANAAKGQSHGAVRAYMPGADDHNFSLIHNAHLEQILHLLYSPPGHL